MVIESLMNPFKAEKKPWEMFFVGLVYSSIGILLSIWVFREASSLVMVFLTVMACVPILYSTMRLEEGKDMEIKSERRLIKEHNKAIFFFMFLFAGITVSCALWYTFLPANYTSIVFEKQSQTIDSINNLVSGSAPGQFTIFSKIFLNNIKVLAFATLFSFIYGAGAIFILTWNASVIGTAIGRFAKASIGSVAGSFGFTNVAAYFQTFSAGILRYAIHGIPEVMAYFYGGLAGGIISVAIVNHHYESEKFSRILFDASDLLIISIIFLFIAALLEVFVTPMLF